jgi:hypothetical protein
VAYDAVSAVKPRRDGFSGAKTGSRRVPATAAGAFRHHLAALCCDRDEAGRMVGVRKYVNLSVTQDF